MPTSAPSLLTDTPAAAFVTDVNTPLIQAIEQALANGVGELIVVDDKGCMVGGTTLESARARVQDGSYLTARVGDVLLDKPLPRLKAQLDADNRVTNVSVDHSNGFFPVAEPWLGVSEYRNLLDAFLSGWISSQGSYIRTFESRFAEYCGTAHGVAVSNGTVAIHLALMALGIGPGDEVIVPDFTFAATINTVLMTGATPVIVDVDPVTWCMDQAAFKAAITTATRAVIPVHVFGHPAPMTEICEIARQHRIYVIEDCAEAHGATYDGKKIGSFGDINAFSFFANKVITTGEGGICLTESPLLAERMRILRDHGMKPERRYWHEQVGYNYRMTNMQAAVGCAQLDRIDEILTRRGAARTLYSQALADIPGVKMSPVLSDRYGAVTWFVCAQVPAAARPRLIEACKKSNIDLRPFFNALSIMPAYARWARPCPVSEQLSQTGVNLPTSHLVDETVVGRIADIFRSVLS